jgi:hypothetical protein
VDNSQQQFAAIKAFPTFKQYTADAACCKTCCQHMQNRNFCHSNMVFHSALLGSPSLPLVVQSALRLVSELQSSTLNSKKNTSSSSNVSSSRRAVQSTA